MRVYTLTEAKRNIAEILNIAFNEEILIRRRDGEVMSINSIKKSKSPFDVKGITLKKKIDLEKVIDAVRESRSRK